MTRNKHVTVVHVKSRTAQAKLVKQLQPIHAPAPTPAPKSKVNPLAMAAFQLGSRFAERGDTFHLDGRPANLTAVMRETNRLLAGQGLPPVPGPPSWAWHG